ncbi:MAG TPA: PH domain-containing protein, partial [Candidatus Poseidoniales archaeon]
IIFTFSIISQFSYSYVMTDKNLYIQRRQFIFYKSHINISFEDLENLITQQSIFGKLIGIGNVLPILKINSDVSPKVNNERTGIQNFIYVIKLLISYKRSSKEIILPPSECFFGIKQPMVIYELANELIDLENGRPDLLVQND